MSMTLGGAAESIGAEVIYRSPITGDYRERGVIEGVDEARRMVVVLYRSGDVHLTHPVNLTLISGGTPS